LEVGFVTGSGNALGHPIAVDVAEENIFGMCLVNDWSARDIQAWEYRPLGPFLSKSFATSMSPWIVQLEALARYRVPAPLQDPRPLEYLTAQPNLGLDLNLVVELNGTIISTTNFRDLYWTMAQQLAHATINGTNVRAGDLYASGTVSSKTV
jgi:fumarylacetoacetase